ncbi:MAG: ABC transporter permease [Planctomycetes bacterium]|nr:ABC transporter permease [Planctomycetota bacterium]MBI3848620.1 ABC transporter permease [Planctomycetota bacterium]
MIIDTIRLAVTLAVKDLRLYSRDKTGLALGFLLPISLVSVFAGVFGSIGMSDDSGQSSKLTLTVADMDGTDASRKLVAAIDDSKFSRAKTTTDDGKAYTRDDIYEAVRDGSISLGVVLEKGFGDKLEAGDVPPIEVIRDPAREVTFQISSQALFMALMEAHGNKLGRALTKRGLRDLAKATGLPPEVVGGIERIAATFFDTLDTEITKAEAHSPAAKSTSTTDAPVFSGMASMLGIRETTVGGGSLDKKERERIARISQPIAGTAVMMLLFGLTACGGTLLREREEGTLRRLFVTPAPRGAILAGKFLFTFALGLVQLVVMFAFGAVVFRLPIAGHLGGILVVSTALCAAATAFGIFIASIGRTQKQIEGFATLVILVMSAVGGSWFPLNDMVGVPQWMIFASHFTLNAWAMDAYQDLWWRNLPVSYVLPEVGVLLGIAVVLSALATLFFRKRFASAEGV